MTNKRSHRDWLIAQSNREDCNYTKLAADIGVSLNALWRFCSRDPKSPRADLQRKIINYAIQTRKTSND